MIIIVYLTWATGEFDFSVVEDPHAVAGLVLSFFQRLPDPLIPFSFHMTSIGVCDLPNLEIQVWMARCFAAAIVCSYM